MYMRILRWLPIIFVPFGFVIGTIVMIRNASEMPLVPTSADMLAKAQGDFEVVLKGGGRIVRSVNRAKPGSVLVIRELDASSLSTEQQANIIQKFKNLHWRLADSNDHFCKNGMVLKFSNFFKKSTDVSTVGIIAEYNIDSIRACNR